MKLVTEGEIKESKEGGYDFKLYGPFIFYQLGGGVVLGFFWDYRTSGEDQINFIFTQVKNLTPSSLPLFRPLKKKGERSLRGCQTDADNTPAKLNILRAIYD